jgi:hypothetical protein
VHVEWNDLSQIPVLNSCCTPMAVDTVLLFHEFHFLTVNSQVFLWNITKFILDLWTTQGATGKHIKNKCFIESSLKATWADPLQK